MSANTENLFKFDLAEFIILSPDSLKLILKCSPVTLRNLTQCEVKRIRGFG